MGYLEFGLLLIVVTVCATAETCEPDEIKFDGKETCICRSDGNGWDCAVNRPDVSSSSNNRRDRRDNSQNDICKPGKTFKRGCNTCYCGTDGNVVNAVCTQMYCDPKIWNDDGTTIIDKSKEERCEPGTAYKNYCNTCVCGTNGLTSTAMCTKNFCDPADWNKDGTPIIYDETMIRVTLERIEDGDERCVPGTSFKLYCNNCGCPKDGMVSRAPCTLMACDPKVWNRNGTRKTVVDDSVGSPTTEKNDDSTISIDEFIVDSTSIDRNDKAERCVPGRTFKKYCNTCVCGDNGLVSRAACTKILCDFATVNRDGTPKEKNEKLEYSMIDEHRGEERCMPGSTFKRYCNTCRCGPNGVALRAKCTTDYCDRAYWARDGTPKVEFEFVPMSRDKRSTDIYCQPRKIYRNDCNTCMCSNDGRSSSCTIKDCLPSNYAVVDSRVCEPGKGFKIDCNDCVCSEDGLEATCTDKVCSPSV